MKSKLELNLELCADGIRECIKGQIGTIFTDLDLDKIADTKAIQVLYEIREVLLNYDIEKTDDFETVEQIVQIFEKYGISTGSCHDFG